MPDDAHEIKEVRIFGTGGASGPGNEGNTGYQERPGTVI